MVLGGGTFQRGLIAALKHLGYEVHVVTNRCQDEGAMMADQCHDFSYTELDRLTDLTKALGAVQVLTAGSELGLAVQSEVQSRLGLKGSSLAFVNRFRDKSLYKEQLAECCGDVVPETFFCNNNKDSELLESFVARFEQGVVVKPNMGGGSGGVAHCLEIGAVRDHLAEQHLSKALIEEYIEGQEYGGDFLVAGGQLRFEACTLKAVNKSQVPKSHLMLQGLQNNPDRRKFLEAIIGHLELTDGVYNADILVREGQMKLIDLSPRIGGNGIPDLVKLSTGVNEWQFMIDQLLHNSPKTLKPGWHMSSGLFMIGTEKEGTIESIVRDDHPFGEAVAEVFWRLGPGEKAAAFTEGARHLGYVIYKATSDDELLKLQAEIENYAWFTQVNCF